MKFLFSFTFCFYLVLNVLSQDSHKKEIKEWRNEINQEFKDPEESPLTEKDLKRFKRLKFFPANSKYAVKGSFELTPNEEPFKMATSTDRLPIYVKYGIARFVIDDQKFELSVYQNVDLSLKEEYRDYLFVPFTDNTNGESSYGGGRYLDITMPEGNSIEIDFNKAYNPYCAYSGRYSCPVPPRENNLNISIKAGVKAFGKH